MLAAINLVLTALVFAGFGIWALLEPQGAADALGLSFRSADGVIAIRAIYGGYLIGAALLFAFLSLQAERRTYGLVAILLIVGPILFTRLYGMWIEGNTTFPHLFRAGLEGSSLLITTFLLTSSRY